MEVNFDYVQLPIFLGIDSTSKITVTLKKGDNVREAATATAGNLNSEIHVRLDLEVNSKLKTKLHWNS